MAARIKAALPAEVRLIESSGGVFEVTCNEQLVFSKRRLGVFPDEEALLQTLREAG